jgi:hypothetical protein
LNGGKFISEFAGGANSDFPLTHIPIYVFLEGCPAIKTTKWYIRQTNKK